ncbi:MAG: ribosome maturation factor RimP [Deltaproteobacteria bacterium]|nr:ribosome maturation factor RimP [Deltaproteobacteria bacterium]MBW2220769.1 ribosome maturation factor RimP [Deltaproteobacteria bacterium]
MKDKEDILNNIRKIADSVCESEGIELVHLEYHRESGGVILRVYIDKPGGVTLDNCTGVSRQLNDLLDIHFEELPPYTLEVSSPGLDRPLVKKGDYEKFKGKTAKIRTKKPLNGQKKFTGVLSGVTGEFLKLAIDGRTVEIPLGDILKGRLQ